MGENPMPEEVAAIVDLRRSTPSSEDPTPVEMVVTSETTTDDAPEKMTATEAIAESISAEVASSDEVTSGSTTDEGKTEMEDKSTIEDPTPAEVEAESIIDDQTPEEIGTDDDPD